MEKADKVTVLVVEDDRAIRNLITTTLESQGYRFETAEKGEEAIMLASSLKPDIMILDLGLPDMDGVEVIKRLRGWNDKPIIVVSARSEDRDKIDALDAGADDYLTKPFSVAELLARIRVALRRMADVRSKPADESVFRNGGLRIDYAAASVFLGEEEVHLTPIEYKLLCLLAKNVGKVLTQNYILENVWGSALKSDSQTLRVFMATLRKKVEENPSQPRFIQTHIGIGYRMNRLESPGNDEDPQ